MFLFPFAWASSHACTCTHTHACMYAWSKHAHIRTPMYPPPCFSTRACFKLFTSFLILLLFSPLLLLQKRLSDIFYYLLLRDHRPFPCIRRVDPPPLFDSKNRLKKTASTKPVFFRFVCPPGLQNDCPKWLFHASGHHFSGFVRKRRTFILPCY